MHAWNALVIGGACDGGSGPLVRSSMTKEEKSAADPKLTPEQGLPTILSHQRDLSRRWLAVLSSLRCLCEGLKGDSSGERAGVA